MKENVLGQFDSLTDIIGKTLEDYKSTLDVLQYIIDKRNASGWDAECCVLVCEAQLKKLKDKL